MSIENARSRAEATTTQKGLSIIATINQRTYETKRPIEESYESEKSRRIVFDDELPKWTISSDALKRRFSAEVIF